MSERYEPTSDFLKAVAADDVPLSGNEFADANLAQLIQMTTDSDRSNRDWAVLLLSQHDLDTTLIRAALIRAASDDDEYVRAEAICGLAKRDPIIALPYIQEALAADAVALPIFEAAALCAHPSLAERLRFWARTPGSWYDDHMAAAALSACEAGTPPVG